MTEESDLFCMLLSACRQGENISLMVFSYCSEDLKYVIIRNKLLRTSLFSRGKRSSFSDSSVGDGSCGRNGGSIMAIKKRMVGIVGVGHVGAHVAFNLGMMGIADEVLLCDLKESKVTSEVQDLNDEIGRAHV